MAWLATGSATTPSTRIIQTASPPWKVIADEFHLILPLNAKGLETCRRHWAVMPYRAAHLCIVANGMVQPYALHGDTAAIWASSSLNSQLLYQVKGRAVCSHAHRIYSMYFSPGPVLGIPLSTATSSIDFGGFNLYAILDKFSSLF